MEEVYVEIEEAVRSGGSEKVLSVADRPEAARQLYERLSSAVATCQRGLIERDVEVTSLHYFSQLCRGFGALGRGRRSSTVP